MSDYSVDRTRWQELTLFDQMGNIGSEVGRAISAKRSGDIPRQNAALDRALDLFSATVEAQPYPRTKEILRARDQFLSIFFGDMDDTIGVENYFNQFALAARISR